uniref:Kazal-like domain-containing protein n=1 Tax=Trichuris muris TaxID=70415 RepID=A0A5S6QQ25_TRIMR
MMKSLALLALFAIVFYNGIEVQAKGVRDCMDSDCAQQLEHAKPCLVDKKGDNCAEHMQSYMGCIRECYSPRGAQKP